MGTAENGSIKRAFTLLEVACRPSGRLTLGQIAEEAGIPVPTAHRLLRTLKLVGAVRTVRGGGYRLGEALARIDSAWANTQGGVRRILRERVAELSRVTGHSAHVAVLDDDRMVRLLTCGRGTAGGFPDHLRCGQYEAYCLAAGQILLARLPREELIDYVYSDSLEPLTGSTVTEPSRLLFKLSQLERIGFAMEIGEFEQGCWSLAVPVNDEFGKAVAAIGISGREAETQVSQLSHLPRIQDVAVELALDLENFPNGVRSIFFVD